MLIVIKSYTKKLEKQFLVITCLLIKMIKFITLMLLHIFDSYNQSKIFNFLKKRGYHKFDILFDIGAHNGETIKLFLKNFNIEKIFSFEAVQLILKN